MTIRMVYNVNIIRSISQLPFRWWLFSNEKSIHCDNLPNLYRYTNNIVNNIEISKPKQKTNVYSFSVYYLNIPIGWRVYQPRNRIYERLNAKIVRICMRSENLFPYDNVRLPITRLFYSEGKNITLNAHDTRWTYISVHGDYKTYTENGQNLRYGDLKTLTETTENGWKIRRSPYFHGGLACLNRETIYVYVRKK